MTQSIASTMKISFMIMALLLSSAVGEEAPSIEAILKSVQKQGAPDPAGLPDDIETDPKKLLQDTNAELLLHKRIIQHGDQKIWILHAITILNSSISYYEESGAAAQFKEDYDKMVNFRTRLADEYVRLTRLEKPNKAEK